MMLQSSLCWRWRTVAVASQPVSPSQLRQLGCALQARMKVLTLQQQISGLYKAMPRDLKQLLLSSPQRAAVLQASDPDWQVRHGTPAGLLRLQLLVHGGWTVRPARASLLRWMFAICRLSTLKL